jgi:hypothetical protein
MSHLEPVTLDSRRPWEAPAIVLERSLVLQAQEGDPGAAPIPGGPPKSSLSPLSLSPGSQGSYCV